jgi:hypothetical protein
MNRETKLKQYTIVGAGLSLLFSVGLWFSGAKDQGVFVGLWVPSILSLGAFTLIGWGAPRGK